MVQAWDREAYFPPASPRPLINLPKLTPGTSVFAFSRLLTHIYGLSLRPADVAQGETWHPEVRKLEVIDEVEGVIGWIYLDLFYREGKGGGATHYTLRCSRRVDDDDENGDLLPQSASNADNLEMWLLKTEAHTNQARVGAHQRPIAVLSCDFDPLQKERGPTTISWQDSVTLWHELGHAMHCEFSV